MNRYLAGLLVISFLINSCNEETVKRISLSVSLINYPEHNDLILYELNDEFVPYDTAFVNNDGDYIFYRNIKKSGFFQLKFQNEQMLNLILHPKLETSIRADAENILTSTVILNNPDSHNILRSERVARGFSTELNALSTGFDLKAIKRSVRDSIIQTIDTLKNIRKQILNDIISSNPFSLSVLPILVQKSGNHAFFNPQTDRDIFVQADTFLIRKYGYLNIVRQFHYQLDSAFSIIDSTRNVKLGEFLTEPGIPTYWSETLSLKKFKGKPVLIVVWKSDLTACTWLIPQLKELISNNENKDIEIVMISLDDSEYEWKSTIDYYRLACWHLGDLKGMESPIIKKWGIRSVPSNYLIDRKGRIVAKNIWGELLESAINDQIAN